MVADLSLAIRCPTAASRRTGAGASYRESSGGLAVALTIPGTLLAPAFWTGTPPGLAAAGALLGWAGIYATKGRAPSQAAVVANGAAAACSSPRCSGGTPEARAGWGNAAALLRRCALSCRSGGVGSGVDGDSVARIPELQAPSGSHREDLPPTIRVPGAGQRPADLSEDDRRDVRGW